ncbi:hypothetical protein LAC81_08120 [Ensifer adhaerens]|uniref:hypothetical protein n=1 Tax=Ensifer adhaerens TaxID=106592 RepID=UPI001CBE5540|nr:hypothetical protein [Ensifer adhaerens]MBZ7921744.1 hypothetical protein [Ensifer adhaerens]UAX94150.1 hypothetical protein LAC78_08115 [Ensifer adhaerens]UAY01785.1 hypothetical protein LAC80_08125 [Ensifer adhaerens]UAY09168.1 hypothetical protein LAC81_08120 [Ensifer adhaerens]
MNIHKLSPDTLVLARDRVLDFIRLAREEITALIPSEQWDEDIWLVAGEFDEKSHNYGERILAFYNSDATISSQQVVTGEPLHPLIKDFAKAYVRYLHSTSPVAHSGTRRRMGAIEFIEAAFRKLGLEPAVERLNVVVLNEAVELARPGIGAARHYQFASSIQAVYRFCMARHFLDAPFPWKHGVRKPKDDSEAIGAAAKERRDRKLPTPEAFHALADVFRTSTTFIDRLYSAISAICVSVPIRAHEVLQLRLNCEVEGRVVSPETGKEVETYGIRIWPGKGNAPQVKWVPTVMVSVVREAVQRLRTMCASARELAAWCERNPGKLWLPDHLETYRESDWVPIGALTGVMGYVDPSAIRKRLRELHVEQTFESARLSSLAPALLNMMPPDFPNFNGYKDQRYSETLIVLFNNEGHAQRGTCPALLDKATVSRFGYWLSGHDNGKWPSVFEVHGFTERDGSRIKITTHSFRHWLNTVAQFKGLSDLDIAKWSGRDIEQNKAYNHVTSEEILSQIRKAVDDGTASGPMFEATRIQGPNRPVEPRDFIEAQIGSALVTDVGICVHDYSLLPCQEHGDCVGCSENVFVKGDIKHRENVEQRLILANLQLAHALEAMGEEFHGADRWVDAHRRNIDRMQRMLAIHDDQSIREGTVIALPDGSPDNEVAMALRDRAAEDEDQALRALLADMWKD